MKTFTLAAGSGWMKGRSIGLLVFAALCACSDVLAMGIDAVPALPPPTGNVIRVSNEPQLQAAVRTTASGTTVLIIRDNLFRNITAPTASSPARRFSCGAGHATPSSSATPS